MNNNITVPDDGPWPVRQYAQLPASPLQPGQRNYSSSNILDFPTLLRVLQHWRWLVLGAVAAGLALAVLQTLLTTPIYRSQVVLEANPPAVAINTEQTREQESTFGSYDFVATQVGLLSSRSVAERTAEDLNLANNPDFVSQKKDAAGRLRSATIRVASFLKVTAPETGNLIKFTYDADSPQLSAQVANGVADSFINTALQRRYEASAFARNFLERQIGKTRSDLEVSERAMVAYAQKQGIISTGTSGTDGKSSGSDTNSIQGESLIALNGALAQATARRVAAEGAYRTTQSVGQTADVTQSTQTLRQQKAVLEGEYQQKRTFQKPEHPEMQALRSQINELGKQISSASAQMTSGRSNTLLAEYRGALSAEQALQSRVSGLKGEVLNLRGRSIQYNILQRDADTNRSLYDALLQRYKEIGVAGGIGMAPVSIVDRATPPSLPYKPNLLFNLAAGLVVGLLAGLGGAIGLEFWSDTIKTREDVRKKLELACLGVVPRTSAKADFVEELKNPRSLVAEAYSAIVAALRFSSEKGTPDVIFVTSTRPSEGKSSSALALAQN
ncbi:MAG: exopolysaccharide transport family protein, partial [Sphingomicrobium sp.]